MRFLGLGPLAGNRYRARGGVSFALQARGKRARLALLLSTALIAVLLSGCGSSDNGVASKSGKEILAASEAAATSADSVHVVSKASQGPLTFTSNLELASNEGRAKVSLLGANSEAIRIGQTVYVKGNQGFYVRLFGPNAHVPQGTWLRGSANSGKLSQVATFTNLPRELNLMLSTPGSVVRGATTTVNGQKVVELKETTKVYKGTLYVSTTGKPYPVLFVKRGGPETGRTTFSEWDQGLSLSAPSPSVDVSAVEG